MLYLYHGDWGLGIGDWIKNLAGPPNSYVVCLFIISFSKSSSLPKTVFNFSKKFVSSFSVSNDFFDKVIFNIIEN